MDLPPPTIADAARRPLAAWQAMLLIALPLAVAMAALAAPWRALAWGGIASLALYTAVVALKVVALLAGLVRRRMLPVGPPVDDARLPVYTVLVPLYREAAVLPRLIAALELLDYPRERLDAKLLVEPDDAETRSALSTQALPPWLTVLTVPQGGPRTKPRACNHGLAAARGELLVVFDAEDRPEPDQLRRAVAGFAETGPDTVCLQARLNCFNRGTNLATRWFTLEYSAWFDLYLPGLHAIGAPIPLGGTSNHFRVAALRRLGGWDAWNVTEDCDLGVRLAMSGLTTRILSSTTWEEAPRGWGAWLRQRSRWMKGYWQTHLAHTRAPLATLRALGAWRMLAMLLTIGGQVATLLLAPLCWAMAGAWLALRGPLFDAHAPWTVAFVVAAAALTLSNLLFLVAHAVAAVRRGFIGLAPLAALLPAYWLMMSLGTWRGFLQFFVAPHRWEKTPHGLDDGMPAERVVERPRQRAAPAALLLLVTVAIALAAMRTPALLDYRRQVRAAALEDAPLLLAEERTVEACWIGRNRVVARLRCTRAAGADPPLHAVLHLKVWDGEWYEAEAEPAPTPDGYEVSIPLDAAWRAADSERPWCRDCLRRVRAAGLQLYGRAEGISELVAATLDAEGTITQPPLAITVAAAPRAAHEYDLVEVPFTLSRTYEHPYDPDEIAVDAEVMAPDGSSIPVPAFYTQDYHRRERTRAETLVAVGAPHWALRYAPRTSGEHRIVLHARERGGAAAESSPLTLAVAPSAHRGYLRVDADRHWFSFERGGFCYPVAINIRSPTDERERTFGPLAAPDPAGGARVIDADIERMAAAGIGVGRVWMAPWFGGLEWRSDAEGFHGLGQYDLRNAWRIDDILGHAREHGVLIELALNSHGPFTTGYDSQWSENPFNARNGGPAATPEAVLTDAEARRLFRQRFRYLAARWGADPALFGWTLWIEINMVTERVEPLIAWHTEMAAWLRENDVGRHPISTEFNTGTGMPAIWSLPGIDYTQAAAYSEAGGLVGTFTARAAALEPFAKPALLEEYGSHAQGGGSLHYLAHEVHDGLWAAWELPVSATPMAWWWNVVFANRMERFHRRFAAFIAGEDLRGVAWRCLDLPVDGAESLHALARCCDRSAYLWIHAPALSDMAASAQYWQQAQERATRYERSAGAFNALADGDPGALWPEIPGASIPFDRLGLTPGRWSVELWDTWTDHPCVRRDIVVAAGAALALPPMTRDLAIKLRRLGD
jgi:cellulose synthase/poly-beta-1,6-N-acetylglucosamine synthase-like glycosyltransferase